MPDTQMILLIYYFPWQGRSQVEPPTIQKILHVISEIRPLGGHQDTSLFIRHLFGCKFYRLKQCNSYLFFIDSKHKCLLIFPSSEMAQKEYKNCKEQATLNAFFCIDKRQSRLGLTLDPKFKIISPCYLLSRSKTTWTVTKFKKNLHTVEERVRDSAL